MTHRRGGSGSGGGGGPGEGSGLPQLTAAQHAAADEAALLAARWATAWGLGAVELRAGARAASPDRAGRRLQGLAAHGWPAAAAAGALPWRHIFRWAAAGERREFFIRPAADSAHRAIFVDDLSGADLKKLPKAWARLVFETSPGNFQVIFRSPVALDAAGRKAAMRALISHLGAGDINSAKGDQIHRWPGSVNYKRDEPFVTRLVEFVPDGEDLPAELVCAAQEIPPPAIEAAQETGNQPRIQIVRRAPVLQRGAPSKGAGDSSGSGLEFGWALSRLRRGIPRQQVIAELAEKALARGKRKNRIDAQQYAALTVHNAESVIRGE